MKLCCLRMRADIGTEHSGLQNETFSGQEIFHHIGCDVELYRAAVTRLQSDALETFQHADRAGTLSNHILQIELYRFTARLFSGIGQSDAGGEKDSTFRSFCLTGTGNLFRRQ